MTELVQHLRARLDVPADRTVTPHTDLIRELGLTHEQIIAMLDGTFPLMIGWEDLDAQGRTTLFRVGMEHEVSAEKRQQNAAKNLDMGSPWTMQRLTEVFKKCRDASYPDNGSD